MNYLIENKDDYNQSKNVYDLKTYLKPSNETNVLTNTKQMEFNEKYSQHYLFILSLAKRYDCNFRIHGSINTPLFLDGESDIDVMFYSNEPYVLLYKLKNDLQIRKVMQRNYSYEYTDPNTGVITKNTNIIQKINLDYLNTNISISIIDEVDKPFFYYKIKHENWVIYYFGFLLYLIKKSYYRFKLMDKKTYKYIKEVIFKFPLYTDFKIKFDDYIMYNNEK